MKTRNLFAAALIAALAFTACSQDDDVVTNDPNVVRFNVSIDGNITTKASIGPDGAGTFDNGDVWGIYGKITTPESWPLVNKQYTVGTTKLYWDNISMDKPVTFSAYYPYISVVDDPSVYKYNVVTEAEPDLLVATPVTASKGETVNLNFKHVMHQLILNFTKGQDVTGDLFDLKFTLLNMKSTAIVNITDGTVDESQATGTTAYPQKYLFEAIVYVAPQDLIVGADWVKIELDGKTYTAKVPANLNPNNLSHPTRLESGKKLTVTLTLNVRPSGQTEVSITSTQISGWGTMQDINADANEQ